MHERRILLDQNVPKRLLLYLSDHQASTALHRGWEGLTNGDLIRMAEEDGFEILITADRNLRYQQNLQGRALAILILPTNRWTVVRHHVEVVLAAVMEARPGAYSELAFE